MNDVDKLWQTISHGINAINLNLQLGDTKNILHKDMHTLTTSPNVRRTFDALASEASAIVRQLDQLEKAGAIPRQGRWNDPITREGEENNTLGEFATVKFVSLGNKELKGKVDTGATTSSLHAENVKVSKEHNKVSFVCPELSSNVITMDLAGAQDVHSADGGVEKRPIVCLDIIVNGLPLKNVEFNLNDRSHMDVPLLLGHNIIKAGNFVVDINEQTIDDGTEMFPSIPQVPGDLSREEKIRLAMNVLVANDVLVGEMVKYYIPNAVSTTTQATEIPDDAR